MAETTTTTTEEPQQQEAVAEQQPEVQETPTGLDDPMLSQLWDDLGIETEKSKAESTQNEEKPEVQPEQSEAHRPKEEASEAEATNKKPEQVILNPG